MPFLLGSILVGVGVILLLVGKLTSDGRLKRNHLAGIRTRGTMASDEAWLAAHKAAWPAQFWAGIAAVLFGLVVAVLDTAGSDWAAFLVIGTLSTVGLVIVAARNGIRAAAKAS